MTFVRVALDVPLPRVFDYRADDATSGDVGLRVRVPFGSGSKVGLVVAVTGSSDQPADKLKPVEAILRDMPPLPAYWLALCEFCSRYYQHPLGHVISFALPPMLRKGKLPRAKKVSLRNTPPAPTLPALLPEQEAAVAALTSAAGFQPFLLHGVTGSGKTEVYLRAIAAVLAQGRQALMLVPEIALTPQLEQRVSERFPGAHIVSAHSGVADAARARGFLEAFEGRADIVLGTRLSVFMPLPRLGLIVVDEEHDTSFKQQEGLRYSARDVAVFRAKQADVPIVLGSATPSLETFHHAISGRYRLLELPHRAVAESPPAVRTVDTRKEKLQDGLSSALIEALATRLERNEQSLLFLNRRGYAPVLACPACGWISRCRRCAANMVLHLADKRLRCHHCGLEGGIPKACPGCGNQDIHPFGRGTQRLEAALSERFPAARILRIDRDSASTPAKWQALLAAIHAGEADILVGTQMLAKGHDFPRLTLVGVVGADAALFAADFRAPERLFAQLMQVGGRSGRHDLPGEVLIQTEYPTHPLYRALVEHDYNAFARNQLDERQMAGFPPFTYQALLRAEAAEMTQALEFLAAANAAALPLAGDAVALYDPVPMRMARLKNLDRAQLLVESHSRPALQAFLTEWVAALHGLKAPRELRWHLDVDPAEY
jgi:primosomal protein N' (replication factor Y)